MIYRLFGWFFSRRVWNFLGLVALALLIWIAGPLVAIGTLRPLESEVVRIIVIVAIFAIWLLRFLWRKWREGRLNAQLLSQLRPRPREKKAVEQDAGNDEIRQLEARFDEAVELLRKTRFENRGKRGPLDRFSKQYLYQLPWYVIIGAPGAGKTTALVNSGLNFPLAERYGKVALRGVGGTRNCDWWFTDDAVLLDTAGRYTTHESDPTGDEQEWRGFLGLLAKYRGRQPINGAMLTVSVEDLLSASDAERAQHAAVLRRRLQELREQLGIAFPVYVLVTKTDLLSGFEEYFASFSRDELAQVWGFTLPYARTQEPGFDLYEAFHAEYALLQRRLDDALPEVVAAEGDPSRRALAYMLPQQFAGLQAILGHFLSDVFATSKFEARVIPRGVYFTSGTQGGETFDQVTGHLKRYLRIDGAAPSTPSAPGEGRSYFLKNLLRDVIFREAGLAGRNLRWERRYRQLHWAGYGLVTAAFVALIAGWALSYRNNSAYVDEVARRVPAVEKLTRDIKITRTGDLLGLMPFLDSLWYLPRHESFEIDNPPLGYRYGLYQGLKLHAAAQGVYGNTLDQVLLPQVARRVEAALRDASASDLEYSYEALRAYLMLYEAERYDAEFMHAWLLSDMQATLPEGYTRRQYEQLSLHLRNLTQGRVLASPFPKDEELVAQAREKLARYTLAQRAYSRLRRTLANTDAASENTVVTLGGAQASAVFVRKSGKPLSQGIPALYSYRGYWDVFNKRVTSVAEVLRSDDAWILNIPPPALLDQAAQRQLVADIKRLYMNDYVAQWDGYLNDLQLAPSKSLLQNIQMARTLSAPESPLVQLVRGVARETALLRESGKDDRSLVDQARDRVSSTREALEQMFGPTGPGAATRADASDEKLERIVDQHFASYRRLAQGEGGPAGTQAPIAATTGLINELYTYLTAADAALRSGSPTPSSDSVTKLRAEAGRLPGPLRDVLNSLSVNASGEVSDVARARMGETVSATIGVFCGQSVAGRYPFSSRSTRDVAPNDMARLFGPNGLMDDFFQKNLATQIDVSGQRWRFKPGVDGRAGASSTTLDAFQRAGVIRDVYFMAGNPMPSYRVAIRPVEMDAGITQFVMDVDGQSVRYAHGPQVATSVQWPGPRGSNQVRIELTPQEGAAGMTTSGPWALNRMLDRAQLRRGASPEITLATFDLGGRKVVLEITASSVKSPFHLAEMQGFACPGAS